MKETTRQKLSVALPKEHNKDIGLMIGCGNCPAIRVFKIGRHLKMIQNRESAGMIIETECEKCGHLIAVTIGWIDATKTGYSYRKMDGTIVNKANVVIDKNGLADSHE